MRLNIDCDLVKQLVSGQLPNKSRHLDELTHEPLRSCDTGQWLSCFDSCQLTILWMANVKDMGLPRHTWDTRPSLLIVSPTLPVQSVGAYVRTLGQSRENQTKIGWPYSMSMGLRPTRASSAREPRYYRGEILFCGVLRRYVISQSIVAITGILRLNRFTLLYVFNWQIFAVVKMWSRITLYK